MDFLVNWLIVLAVLLAATWFLCLRAPPSRHPPELGRARRIESARLLTQAIFGFWTAALIVAREMLVADSADASPAGFAAIAFAALGLAAVAAYWSACAVRLRRPRLFIRRS
ncbi:hypothetical protein [Burkholderia ubonensis]|uniref:Uncharacterized protein n=1 Tax=Burkholderia ubonensis subsp. mesacidophila TaxID=265293 RepID=A0A2A4F7E6_9BURK|nr:hypothetical protein [Burkholderia ubonensis]PCE28504.1 hypothetical protein BZL54_29470 [Burkholderia ubonensis subsp. mesacidophila]